MVARIRKGARAHLYITEWRDNRGLTLDQLANRIGVAENTVWRWENEQHRLNPEKIAALAHHLQLEPQELWRPPPSPNGPPPRPSLDSLVRDADADTFSTAHDIISRLVRKSG